MANSPRQDRSTVGGTFQGRVAADAQADQVRTFSLVFRLLFLPLWLPIVLWRMRRRNREMIAFAAQHSSNTINSVELVEEITLRWVKEHPRDYFYQEHDPKVPKLKRKFSKILERVHHPLAAS